MLFDLETDDRNRLADRVFDVAVIGTGPAGISLARRLAAKGWSVGLFEGGGLEISSESQEVYEGDLAGLDYFSLDTARLRYFGGTSNHWEGWSRRLDNWDFEPLDYHPLSGWPIAKSDLDPYAPDAAAIIDLPAAAGTEMNSDVGPFPALKFDDEFERIGFFHSPPTRFGPKYLSEIRASDKISLFINANLVDLKLTENLAAASEGVLRSYNRPEPVSVKARYFAICLGGIENPRFLLNCTSQIPVGIGNERDLVGRYFCEHPHVVIGSLMRPAPFDGLYIISTNEQFAKQHKVLNFSVRMSGWKDWKRRMAFSAVCTTDITKTVYDFLLGSKGIFMSGKDFPCAGTAGPEIPLEIVAEQALNPDSRVRLGTETDRFGNRRTILDWRLTDLDYHTMRTVAVEIGRVATYEDVKAGRVKIDDWLLKEPPEYPKTGGDQEVAGFHHMCSTRMSADASTGVVNGDCRLHTVDNVYMGGSSVFSTAGHANPTFSIVQLALRLGDHLHQRLSAA